MSWYGLALSGGYAFALAGWLLLARWRPAWWPPSASPDFARPWRELGWALVATLGVLAVGQLYVRHIRLPETGSWRIVTASLNQVAIFLPMLLLLPLRGQSPSSAWLRTDHVPRRLGAGLLLALIAIAAFGAIHPDADGWPRIVSRVYRPDAIPIAVQVLLEDLSVAILVVRFAAVIGRRGAVVAAAILFAAAHVPAMLASGSGAHELVPLVRDAALGAGLLAAALRSSDVWWVWMVHFAMDMMQFVSGAAPSS